MSALTDLNDLRDAISGVAESSWTSFCERHFSTISGKAAIGHLKQLERKYVDARFRVQALEHDVKRLEAEVDGQRSANAWLTNALEIAERELERNKR